MAERPSGRQPGDARRRRPGDRSAAFCRSGTCLAARGTLVRRHPVGTGVQPRSPVGSVRRGDGRHRQDHHGGELHGQRAGGVGGAEAVTEAEQAHLDAEQQPPDGARHEEGGGRCHQPVPGDRHRHRHRQARHPLEEEERPDGGDVPVARRPQVEVDDRRERHEDRTGPEQGAVGEVRAGDHRPEPPGGPVPPTLAGPAGTDARRLAPEVWLIPVLRRRPPAGMARRVPVCDVRRPGLRAPGSARRR